MSSARFKSNRERIRYFQGLHDQARADALRAIEALAPLLRGRRSLKEIHYAAHAAHMASALVYTYSSALAQEKATQARKRAGVRPSRARPTWRAMGWRDAAEIYNERKRREAPKA